MSKLNKGITFLLLVFSLPIIAQSSVAVVKNYNNWKWGNVHVAKNKYISVAVVPDAAGRVLEYNLGNIPSLWVNPDLFGESYAPTDNVKMSDWRNFGGYRLVPIPVNNCAIDKNGDKVKRWPPPAIIGDSPYQTKIITNSEGNKSIEVISGVQNLPVPTFDGKSKTFIQPTNIDEQIQYNRSLHIENGSSLVYINHRLKNVGSKTIKRGIMITSQHPSRSKPELEDGENFLAFVPFSEKYKLPDGNQYEITATPESRWRYVSRNRMPLDKNNPEHIKKYFNHGTNWTGEVAPGIFEIHFDYYLMSGFHIISSEAWLCYVDKLNMTAFAKLFEPYSPNLQYEDGVNASIFNSGMVTGYLETEVKTPIYTLKPGSSFEYREIHGAAKIASLPILSVNTTGVITKRLSLNKNTSTMSGAYGVFIEGIALLKLLDSKGEIIDIIELQNVSPFNAFSLSYSLEVTSKVAVVELLIKSSESKTAILDTFTF